MQNEMQSMYHGVRRSCHRAAEGAEKQRWALPVVRLPLTIATCQSQKATPILALLNLRYFLRVPYPACYC